MQRASANLHNPWRRRQPLRVALAFVIAVEKIGRRQADGGEASCARGGLLQSQESCSFEAVTVLEAMWKRQDERRGVYFVKI